jgi:hypothetical protein
VNSSIQVFNSDSDDDTLARALLVLLTTQDEADYSFYVYERTCRAHKYILALNTPSNFFAADDDQSTVSDTLMPSTEIFEILLHYIYAQGSLVSLHLR